jgi:hypothetical protein
VDQSYDALRADKYGRAAISWTGPLIIFGWVILVIAAFVFIVTLFATMLAIVNGNDNATLIGVAIGGTVMAAFAALVMVLQAAVILAVAYYIRARAHWTRYEAQSALRANSSGGSTD